VPVLGIDTSTKFVAAGLWGDEGFLGEICGAGHLLDSERLLSLIMILLESSGRNLEDLTGIGAVVGPGAFTGLRVGIGTVQGLAESRHLPVVGLCSLEVLAFGCGTVGQTVCPLIYARKGYVYAALYEATAQGLRELRSPATCQPEEIVPWITKPVLFVGSGFGVHREFYREVLKERVLEPPESLLHPSLGRSTAYLAYRALLEGKGHDPALLLPEYLGASTAEINWKKRHRESTS